MTEQELDAMRIVQKHSMVAGAVGLVPIPLFDMAAIAAVQVKMLSTLASHYGQELKKEWGKATVSTLIGAVLPTGLASGTAGVIVRQIPVVGSVLGFVTVSAFAIAITYAVGTVFIRHFESGGTLLDFSAESARDEFVDEFKKARAKA